MDLIEFQNITNATIYEVLSNIEDQMNENKRKKELLLRFEVTLYGLLFIVGSIGNILVLKKIYFGKKLRMNIFITNLAIADLLVVLIVIPYEAGWRITYAWKAPELACKLLLAIKNFGFYYSSLILTDISLDRFFAVIYPFTFPTARRRNKILVITSFVISILLAIPQVIFGF